MTTAAVVSGPRRPLSGAEFRLFQELIHREAGIFLSEAKRALLVGRLSRRLRELGIDSFGEYHAHVTERDPAELVRMLECITTHETRFFREPAQFDLLEQRLIPEWIASAAAGRRPRRVRVWSAACSSGEEPYSLAMVLLSHLTPEAGWEVEVLATDLSTAVLEKARAAVWPVERATEIPQRHLKPFMLRGTAAMDGTMKAGPEIRSVVRFQQMNLSTDPWPVNGPFDLILCRNVLIYFAPEGKTRVVTRLLRHLAPGAPLFLGQAESAAGLSGHLRRVGPAAYLPAAAQ